MSVHPPQANPAGRQLAGALVWLRRDLRAEDHAALHQALRTARRVWCAFVFDRAILDPLPRQDRRVEFIRDSLQGLDEALREMARAHGIEGAGLIVRHGQAEEEVTHLAQRLAVQAVWASHDDDPYALERDRRARGRLADIGVALHTVKDHVVFERAEVMTASGTPYGVFTPYKNAWLKRLAAESDAAIAEHELRTGLRKGVGDALDNGTAVVLALAYPDGRGHVEEALTHAHSLTAMPMDSASLQSIDDAVAAEIKKLPDRPDTSS